MDRREVEEKLRRYEIDGKTIECEIQCGDCKFLSKCKSSDKESLRYRPDVRSFGSELQERSTILPFIDTSSEDRARKLYQVLIEMAIADRMKKRWSAFDIAKNLQVSTYRIRKRLDHLIEHKFVKNEEKSFYEFSFGRITHNLIKFYCFEFEKRFGRRPRISAEESGILSVLIKDYSDEDLRLIISRYLELDDKFLKDCGYALKFLPMKINRVLIEMSDKKPQKSSDLTKEQIQEYLKGKEQGFWTGEEEWARTYENAVKALQVCND